MKKYEHYSVFIGANENIIELNPSILEYGFEFIKVDYELFEERFSNLLNYDRSNISKTNMSSNAYSSTVSIGFYYALRDSFYHNNLGYCVFLKEIDVNTKYSEKIIIFSRRLVEILRLLSSEFLFEAKHFSINDENSIYSSGTMESLSVRIFSSTYDSKNVDIKLFDNFLKNGIPDIEIVKLAKINYFLTYNIQNNQVKYILYITALESILNRNDSPITHIFARHLALLFSENKEDFNIKFKEFKKIYDNRSKIVHGTKAIKITTTEIFYLKNIVRETILKCIELNLTKDELFNHLNSF